MFAFICIIIGFSDVNTVLVAVSVIVDVAEVCFGIFTGVSDIFVIISDIVDVTDDGFDIFRGVSDIVSFVSSDIVDVGYVCSGILRGVSAITIIAIDVEAGISVLDWIIYIVIILVIKSVDSKIICIY